MSLFGLHHVVFSVIRGSTRVDMYLACVSTVDMHLVCTKVDDRPYLLHRCRPQESWSVVVVKVHGVVGRDVASWKTNGNGHPPLSVYCVISYS